MWGAPDSGALFILMTLLTQLGELLEWTAFCQVRVKVLRTPTLGAIFNLEKFQTWRSLINLLKPTLVASTWKWNLLQVVNSARTRVAPAVWWTQRLIPIHTDNKLGPLLDLSPTGNSKLPSKRTSVRKAVWTKTLRRSCGILTSRTVTSPPAPVLAGLSSLMRWEFSDTALRDIYD